MGDRVARPLVLTRRSGSSVLVEHCCPRAAQAGLRPGITLGQAQAMAPGLIALPAEPLRDRALLHQLAQWATRFGPSVEPVEPDTLLIDVTGCARLFGGEENIARQAVEGLARQGFYARAAIADTVGAAYALASAGEEAAVVAPPGQSSAYLAPLPPAALRIEPRVAEQLDALGVRTIGDLLMLPRTSLPARFGPNLVLRLQQALGEVFEGIAAHRPPDAPAARFAFETAVHDPQAVRAVIDDLLAEVFDEVVRREAALRRLECVLYGERVPPVVISIGLSRGSRSRRHVGELLVRRLEQIDLTPGVCGVVLTASETSPWRPAQAELFDPRPPGDEEALACLIDRIADRIGYAGVLKPRVIDDHQPEMAYRYVSVAEAGLAEEGTKARRHEGTKGRDQGIEASRDRGIEESRDQGIEGSRDRAAARTLARPPATPGMQATPINQKSEIQNPKSHPARPLQLLPRPIPIRAMALVPDGPPTWLNCCGREHRVVRAAGPERIETAWWRGADVRRDYFRVVCESGEQLWVFRALNERRWYLHGVFV